MLAKRLRLHLSVGFLLNSVVLLVLITMLTWQNTVLAFSEGIAEGIAAEIMVEQKISTEALLQALMLGRANGSFVQEKHFKFLSMPIRSTGAFITEQASVLWQTQSPVFSEVLIKPAGIYRRLISTENYQPLVENTEFSSLLSAIFTGNITDDEWQIDEKIYFREQNYCLLLKPKAAQLQQLFQQVDLCVPRFSAQDAGPDLKQQSKPLQASAIPTSPLDISKRQISLFDLQGNKTEISMQIISRTLTAAQVQALSLNPEDMVEALPEVAADVIDELDNVGNQ